MKTRSPRKHITALLVFLYFIPPILAQEEPLEDSILGDLIYEYSYKGYFNLENNINLDTAEYYLKKALELQYSNYSFFEERMANNHISLASVYRRLYDYDQARFHLEKAEDILKNRAPNSYLFGSIYNNKGNIIATTNDVYVTKQYYEYALEFLTRNGYRDSNDFYKIFSNYIRLLFEMGEDVLAEDQLSRINVDNLKLSPTIEYRFNLIFANAFLKLDNYDNALYYYNKAYDLAQTTSIGDDKLGPILYFYGIIDFYIHYGEYEKANESISQAFQYIESATPQTTNYNTKYYSNIQYRKASILFFQGKFKQSLELTNRGVDNLNSLFNELAVNKSNIEVRSTNTVLLPEFQILRSRVLYNLYLDSGDEEHLVQAIRSYDTSISLLNSMKLSMQSEDSKLYATSQILEVYNEAIVVGELLYRKKGELEYLEKSFEFAESSKSFALLSEIKNVEAMEFSDLPSDSREKEERFIGQIQAYEEMLYDEQLMTDPDSGQIEFYKEKLFHLKDDYNDLMQDIEQNNAQYFELKYNPKFVTLEEVQKKLPYREALIEYVLTDTMLLTFVIDNKGINVISQDIGPEFARECLEFYKLIHAQNFSSGVHDNYRQFITLGRKFYNILVEPCFQYTDKKSLIIVPDGPITYIPFGCLLTDDADMEYINYLDLPYMVRDFSVGYSHSSTLMFSERLKSKSPENKVLAFAPKYAEPPEFSDPALLRQAINDDGFLLPLRGIINEVQSINETVPARVFLNEKATEANFKKYASDYNVLHLAMHTIMKDDNPLHSLLAFTTVEGTDSTEDNKLYAYEIYNMKLNAQMAVLSSCSSGFGKMQKGEGMMSLARGFIYAGCPSIVMTLWQVADQSSSELMKSFYRYLKKGKSKQEAMRLAKIEYLKTSDDLTSNPYFWSGFVVVGDSSPIYGKSGMVYWIGLIALFIGVLIYFQFKKS